MDQSPAQSAATAAVPEMTGEDAHPVGDDSDLQASAGFDGALRGYDRRQVNKYVARSQKRIEDLTAELTTVRRNEQILSARVDELTKQVAMCSCDPNKPESSVVGARLRQIIDIASSEAADLRQRAEVETLAMREEAENLLANARQQAEQATSALEAMLAHRRAAEEAAAAERRAAIEGWAERHVNEARDTARRVIERAGAVSSQVIASARWLVDALGAHRDALSEQLGGVQRRIDELPSLEAAAAIPGEKLANVPTEDHPHGNGAGTGMSGSGTSGRAAPAQPAGRATPVQPAGQGRPDEAEQAARTAVRMAGAPLAGQAPSGERHDGPPWGTDPRSAPGSAQRPPAQLPGSAQRPPAHAAPQAPGGPQRPPAHQAPQAPGAASMSAPGGGLMSGPGGTPGWAPGGVPVPPHGGVPVPPHGGVPVPPHGGVPVPPHGGAPVPAPGSAPRPPAHAAPPDAAPYNRPWTPVVNPGQDRPGLHRG